MKSWKTTTVGILTAIGIIAAQLSYLFDTDPQTVFDLQVVFAALGVAGIGFFARDNNVTSEEAGAK